MIIGQQKDRTVFKGWLDRFSRECSKSTNILAKETDGLCAVCSLLEMGAINAPKATLARTGISLLENCEVDMQNSLQLTLCSVLHVEIG